MIKHEVIFWPPAEGRVRQMRVSDGDTVYSLFIVLTATLRTASSWVSRPSITEPNSPEDTNRNTTREFSCEFSCSDVESLVFTVHNGYRKTATGQYRISHRTLTHYTTGQNILVSTGDNPDNVLCTRPALQQVLGLVTLPVCRALLSLTLHTALIIGLRRKQSRTFSQGLPQG